MDDLTLVAVCPDCGNEVERAGWTCGECADFDDPDGDECSQCGSEWDECDCDD